MLRRYFKIEITNAGAGTGNKAGFVDSMKTQDYTDYDPTAGTTDQYTAKALGYLRWKNLNLQLVNYGSFYMNVDELAGATSLLPPTKITMTYGYDQPETLYVKKEDGTELKDIDCLKYTIAKSLASNYNGFADLWNPEPDNRGRNPSGAPIGYSSRLMTAEKLFDTVDSAMASITVTEVFSEQ